MYNKVIESKPTNCRNPYLCILDEYGYYAVNGFAVVPAQARSLGFSVIFAGQDLPAFQKTSKEEAASIGANTNIKICMKLEDPEITWEFFLKSAGESYVSHVTGFESDAQSITNQFNSTRNTQIEKRARIDLLDLKEQREGEYHIFFKSTIVRAKSFFANPKPVKELRLNQFVRIEAPTDMVLRNLIMGFESFKKLLQSGDEIFFDTELPKDEAKNIAELFMKQNEDMPLEKGISFLLFYHDQTLGVVSSGDIEEELPDSQINIFSTLLLAKAALREQISGVEAYFGKAKRNTQNTASELLKDIQLATHYPPEVKKVSSVIELVEMIDYIISNIALKTDE